MPMARVNIDALEHKDRVAVVCLLDVMCGCAHLERALRAKLAALLLLDEDELRREAGELIGERLSDLGVGR